MMYPSRKTSGNTGPGFTPKPGGNGSLRSLFLHPLVRLPFLCYIGFDTDIQLKTLSRRLEVFNMKIIMRRDSMIF